MCCGSNLQLLSEAEHISSQHVFLPGQFLLQTPLSLHLLLRCTQLTVEPTQTHTHFNEAQPLMVRLKTRIQFKTLTVNMVPTTIKQDHTIFVRAQKVYQEWEVVFIVCEHRCLHWLPLLLLEIVVAALLALQVKFSVLQFRRQSLCFLLQLLDVSLRLLVVSLQVADLRTYTHSFSSDIWQDGEGNSR